MISDKGPVEYHVKSNINLYEDYDDPLTLTSESVKDEKGSTLHQPAGPEEVVAVDSDEELGKKKKDRYALLWRLLKTPVFTPCLMLAQTVLMILMVNEGIQQGDFGNIWQSKKFLLLILDPLIGPGESILIQYGARRTDLVINNYGFWRIFASMFLNSGVIQYIFNMLFEIQVLFKLERTFGFIPIAFIWLSAGLGGNLLSSIFLPNIVVVGSTTTLAGITACIFVEVIINWEFTKQKWKQLATAIIQCLVLLALGFLPFIDNFANIGGFICGLLASFVIVPRNIENQKKWHKILIIINRIICFGLLAMLILAGFLVLYLAPQVAANCYPNGWCYYLHPDW